MKVEGAGDTAFATSEGAGGNQSGAIDLKAVPEAPVSGQKAAPAAAPSVGQGKMVAVPASGGALKAAPAGGGPVAKPAAAASAGGLVQIGSYPTEAVANAEWAGKSRRFGYLAALPKSIEKAQVNGKTVYRLRVAAGGDATAVCGKLKVAGEACFLAH